MLTRQNIDLVELSRGIGTVPSGPNCVSRGESGANFDPELFVSGPPPVARGVARERAQRPNYILLICVIKCIKCENGLP